MLNRLILVLLALALPFLGAGAMGLDAAPSVDGGWDPDTASLAGFEGLPDLSRDSAKFMVITGDNNQSIGLEPLQLGITIPAAQASARIALFDADSTGLWDQRAGDAILLFAPRVQYEVFVDPDGSVLAALAALPPLPASTDPDTQLTAAELNKRVVKCFSNDAAFANSDNKWAALYDRATNSTEVQSAKSTNGDFKFVFRATLLPNSPPVPDFPGAPGTGIQGTERVGFKVAYNGTYLLKAGDVLGFAGGSIDERYFIVAADTEQANTQDPLPGATIPGTQLTNAYDGKFNFPFHHSWFCKGDINLYEGDADWNANIPNATIDMNPTGVPPDNGGLYDITLPIACQPPGYVKPVFFKRDNSVFKIGTAIRWFVFPIPAGGHAGASPEAAGFAAPFFASNAAAGGNFGNSETAPANWPGHASVNAFCQQSLAPENSAAVSPFDYQSFPLTKSVVDTRPGLWCVRWDGVDASNFVFMKFDKDIGSTPKDSIMSGRVFCDDNANTTYEAGIDSSLGVAINLSAQQVDPVTGVALPGVSPILITTSVAGVWGPIVTPAGRYVFTITTPHTLNPTPPVVLPLDVSFAQGECELDVLIPLNCKQDISGKLFCDNDGDCVYKPAPGGLDTDLPASFLPHSSVVLVRTVPGPLTTPRPPQTTTATGEYSFKGLPFGTYTVTVAPPVALPTSCPTTLTATLGINTGSVTRQDFGYVCTTMGCGFVWCDDNKDGVFDAGEMPITVGGDWSVEVTPAGAAAPVLSGQPVVGVPGRWCVMGLVPGQMYTATVKYKGTTTYPKNTMLLNASPSTTFTAVAPPGVTPDTNFRFMCTEEICGYIYCDTNGNCTYEAGVDVLFTGPDWTVEITPEPQTTPPTAALVVSPNPAKGNKWCADLGFGTWKITVKYKGGTTFPWPYVLTTPATGMHTVTVTGDSTNGPQNFCFNCKVSGKAYCDEDNSNSFTAGDLLLGGSSGPGNGWEVTLTHATNPAFNRTVPVAAVTGVYMTSLPAGNWTAAITYNGGTTWPSPVAMLVKSPAPFTVPSVTTPDLDFIFKCARNVNIEVFCDTAPRNGRLDAGEALLLGPDWDVRITGGPAGFTPINLPVPVGGKITQSLPLGSYTATVRYKGGSTWPTNPEIVTPIGLTSKPFTISPTGPTPTVPFPFTCDKGSVSGTVFCDADPRNGKLDPGENRLVGPNWTVTVAGGPAGFVPVTVPVLANGTWSVGNLPGGNYTATVLYNLGTTWPTTPEIVTPIGLTVKPFTIARGALVAGPIPFPFSCEKPPADICVKVFCDEDCDGVRDAGEGAYPGVTVELRRAGVAVLPRWLSTVTPDEFCWTQLTAGTYTLHVVGLPPNTAVSTTEPLTITVLPGQVGRGEFGICKLGKICGVAFEEEVGDWDKKYQLGETLLGGVQVQLSGNGLVAPFPTTTTGAAGTPSHGRFCFESLKPGAYTVTVLLPTPASLGPITLTGPVTVNSTVVNGAPTPDVEFPFATAELAGLVWCELDGTCDGNYDAGADQLLSGIDVTLRGLSGDAAGFPATTTQTVAGAYEFLRLKGGGYEVRIAKTANNALKLKGKVVCFSDFYTPLVPICERTEVDFSYYPCVQDLKVQIFVDKSVPENCTYDAGTDGDLSGVVFTVHPVGDPTTTLATGTTTGNGTFTVTGLAAGTYWVCIDGDQTVLDNLEKCVPGPDCPTLVVVLEPCKDECVEIGYKETCRKEPCCEGKLHEVVFKTAIWVGDCTNSFAVSAHLMETCDPCSGVSGEAWMDYSGRFPGPVTGYDGVVTIENVVVKYGVATVTIRLTATGDEFLRGYFDDGKHLLAVFVNGKSNEACVRLRCEDTLPGSMFPWSKECGPKPDCDWTPEFAHEAFRRWLTCKCPATFIVCEQCSYEWWKRCVPCVPKPESKIVNLRFRNCKTDACDHKILVKLKWNNVVYDTIRFEFQGDSWTGSKTGKNGHLTVLKVYKDGCGWRAKIRIDYDCGCPEDALPCRVLVWAGFDCCSLDKIVKLPCEHATH